MRRHKIDNLRCHLLRCDRQIPFVLTVLVIDDNSPDGTGAVADDLALRYPVRVIHRAGKLGLGTAVVDGFRASDAEVVGVIDADLSHPPDLVPRMLRTLHDTRADIVIGDRYGTSCVGIVSETIETTLRGLGYAVSRNKPYAGGFITEHYGNPAAGVHSIQLEIVGLIDAPHPAFPQLSLNPVTCSKIGSCR